MYTVLYTMWGETGVSALAVGDSELNAWGDGFTLSGGRGGARAGGLSRLAGSGIPESLQQPCTL